MGMDRFGDPDSRGLRPGRPAAGFTATAGDLGAAIGPLVAYAVLETAGLRAAYGLCAALMLSALLLLATVRAVAPAARGA